MLDKQHGLVKTLIISLSVITASLILAFTINDGTHYIGDSMNNGLYSLGKNLSPITTAETTEFRDYMSVYEASAFLMINIDSFTTFIQTGELDGTFTIIQEEYVFSKDKLTQWLENRIGNE